MIEQASFTLRNRNPDVLTCIANLSNDEVFTPPELANKMLDMLTEEWAKDHHGENIWENKDVTFLDPCTKSGVFLREITARLTRGLEKEIPNLDKRVDHILSKQVFGIGITKLTSLLARRSVYCSKSADGEHSIAKSLKSIDGNIWYQDEEHHWEGNKCLFCGASRTILDRNSSLSNYDYAFIHTDDIKKKIKNLFGANMQFDVIIGNPPYQLNDGGGTGSSAVPIYQKFIEQAKQLSPRYLSMIIPARWFSGGRGLDEFREEMLNDKKIRVLHDFQNSNDCFSGVNIEGGVCFFLWNKDNEGLCKIYSHSGDGNVTESERLLLEKGSDTFVRFNEAISILEKINKLKEESFSNIISANDPFGFDMREENSYKRIKPSFKLKPFPNSIKFLYNGWKSKGVGYIEKNQIRKNLDLVKDYKVYISKAYGMGSGIPSQVINQPILGLPNSCCTETYLFIGPFKDSIECENVISYMQTKFFRLLVLLIKNTQNAMKKVYSFVPMQDFSEKWTDDKLYEKYKLSSSEISFIENMIRPMSNGAEDE